MQCSCGGDTSDHKVVRKKIVVAEFVRCRACGRVTYTKGKRQQEGK